MLYWALIFFGVSIVSAVLGLTGVAGITMDIAQFLVGAFFILALLFVGLAVWGAKKGKDLIT